MTLRIIIFALLLVSSGVAQTTPQLGIRDNTPHRKAFVGARIIASPSDTIDGGVLLVSEGLVVQVGEAGLEIPEGYEIHDMSGKWLYPGLIDPMSHYGVPEAEIKKQQRGRPKYEADRSGADAWNDAIHSQINWVDHFDPDKKTADKLLDIGVTVAHSARPDGVFRGRAVVALLDPEKLSNDVIIRSHGLHQASFDKGSSTQQYPSSLMGSIALIRQTLLDVDWYDRAHSAWARNPAQERPEINLALEALAGIRNEGLVFETRHPQSLLRAERIGREMRVPMIHVGSGYEYAYLDQLKAIDQPIILPLSLPEVPLVSGVDDEYDVDLADLRHWEWAPYNPMLLDSAGFTFAFTAHRLTDLTHLWKNLRKAIHCGLSETTALAALTTVPADIAGIGDRVGTLDAGKLANFIVTDGNLFDSSSTRYSVWVSGREAKRFLPIDQTDFRGSYALFLGDTELGLEISGSMKKLAGEISSEGAAVSLSSVSADVNRLSFTAELDTFALPGVSRFSLWQRDTLLSGEAVLPNGTRREVTARLLAATPAAPDSTETDNGDSDSEEMTRRISRLTFPNSGFGVESVPPQQTVLITNATVWTCDSSGTLEETAILFREGKVAAIGKDLDAPREALIIDGTGLHVTPGIIDEHSHTGISGDVNEGTHAITSETRIGDVINATDINMYRAVAGGTTAALILHGSANPIGAQTQAVKFRWGNTAEELKIPDATPEIKFALGENVKQSNWGDYFTIRYPQTRMGVETIIKDAFRAAQQYKRDHSTYERLNDRNKERTVPPRRDLQLETLVEILNGDRLIQCHAYVYTEVLMLIRLAEQFGIRVGSFIHILEGYKVADEMAAHGAAGTSFSDWWAYKFEVYDAIPQNPCLMAERGVTVSVNSDSPELGRRLNQEAAKAIMHCGMEAEEAIKLVTLNPAINMGADHRIGSLRVGKDADFVIWNGDPLSIYSRAEQTWIDGRQYFDLETDLKARDALQAEKQALIQKILVAESRTPRKGKESGASKAPHHPPDPDIEHEEQER